jgi:tRNA (guanine37-N1)-methyltransferase
MNNPWKIQILTLFPELFPGPLAQSVTGRGLNNNLWSINTYNIRDFANDKHKTVDDIPYGGGSGMIMKPDVLGRAIKATFDQKKIIYLSPRGKLFNQEMARNLAKQPELNLICGRFEGIDERVIERFNIEEISIGDYILSSGDLAAYILIDACLRNIPGILNCYESLNEESFGNAQEYNMLLEYPQYTRPMIFDGITIPNILLSGNHQEIKKWRLAQAKKKTEQNRPDLLKRNI